MWLELFRVLGMDYKTLVSIRDKYPKDAEISLFEAISEWIRGQDPKPSWRALVDALRNKMLEAKLADGIAERHFTPLELKNYKSSKFANPLLPHNSSYCGFPDPDQLCSLANQILNDVILIDHMWHLVKLKLTRVWQFTVQYKNASLGVIFLGYGIVHKLH